MTKAKSFTPLEKAVDFNVVRMPVLRGGVISNGVRGRSSLTGFTLIEFIVVISIVGILSAGFSSYIIKTIDLWKFWSFRNEIVNQTRVALIRMGRDIRQIKKRTPADQTIEEAAAASLQFRKVVDDSEIKMKYSYNSSLKELFYTVDTDGDDDLTYEAAYPLLSEIKNFSFTYYDRSGNVTTDASQVYLVKINVEVEKEDQSLALHYELFPRNLKY